MDNLKLNFIGEDIWTTARRGDIEVMREHLRKHTNIHAIDNWGNSPIYYAALCGHYFLVEFLLQNGARDDSLNRAYMNALNLNIRHLLKGLATIPPSNISGTQDEIEKENVFTFKSLMPIKQTRNLEDNSPMSAGLTGFECDITIISGEEDYPKEFEGHLCILVPRWYKLFSKTFNAIDSDENLEENINKTIAGYKNQSIKCPYSAEVVSALLRHCYTNDINFLKPSHGHTLHDLVKDLLMACDEYDFNDFGRRVAKLFNGRWYHETQEETMSDQFQFAFPDPGTQIRTYTEVYDMYTEKLERIWKERDNRPKSKKIIQDTILENVLTFIEGQKKALIFKALSDITLTTMDKKSINAHKAILVARSSYFNIILGGYFNQVEDKLESEMSYECTRAMLLYLYTNKLEISDEYAVELLVAANKFNMEHLKVKAEKYVGRQLDVDNVLALTRVAEYSASNYLRILCQKFTTSTEFEITPNDLTLIVGKKKFSTKKMLIASFSPYFMNFLLRDEMKDSIEINDLSEVEMEFFISKYNGKTMIPKDTPVKTLLNVMKFAKQFQFDILFKKIREATIVFGSQEECCKIMYGVYEFFPEDANFLEEIWFKNAPSKSHALEVLKTMETFNNDKKKCPTSMRNKRVREELIEKIKQWIKKENFKK